MLLRLQKKHTTDLLTGFGPDLFPAFRRCGYPSGASLLCSEPPFSRQKKSGLHAHCIPTSSVPSALVMMTRGTRPHTERILCTRGAEVSAVGRCHAKTWPDKRGGVSVCARGWERADCSGQNICLITRLS